MYVLHTLIDKNHHIIYTLKERITIIIEHIRAMTRDFQQCVMCDQQWLRPACAYAQTDQNRC